LRVALAGGEAEHEEIISGLAGIERLSPEAAVGFFPLLDQDRIAAASFERDVFDIDADALLQGAARSARSKGAELVFGTNVTRLARRNSAWSVDTDKGSFEAGTLVNAAGAWSNDIAQLADLAPLDLVPSRRSIAILPMPAVLDAGNRTPFTVTAPLRWYAKVEAGRLLVSPADQDPVPPQDAFADDMVLAEGLQRFSDDTGFEVTRLEGSWAGLRTMTPDECPAIGFDPHEDGFFWLAGQCGFGIQCAPGIARFAKSLLEGVEEKAELQSALAVARLRRSR
jgi:D-arginine dehydrogenase